MKIELFDMDEFVDINNLKEVTSPVLFERGGTPNPDGLVSNEIFGMNMKSRKETFAYIDLGGYFIHPHIYKIIRRVYRNIDKLVNGEENFSITKEGELVKDHENGDTGIEFLYNNWNKIKWSGNGGMSTERTNLISKTKKNEVFMNKFIVIPAFYRDISTSAGGGGETPELDKLYVQLIRMCALIKDRDMFDFSFHSTNYNIQKTLVSIYDYFKDKLDKKNGLLRKYLMGKNVDYCTRSVISAPLFNEEDPSNNQVSFRYASVPISQVCVLCYPFMVAWLRNFFEREVIENKSVKTNLSLDKVPEELITFKNPEAYFTEKYIKKAIDRYVSDPSSRYNTIEVPTTLDKPAYLMFTGRYANTLDESSGIVNRRMTWTDLLFMASNDIVKDKHILVTRYPILDQFGVFLARINVASTLRTVPMIVNGKTYKWYPSIDLDLPHEEVANNFMDTIRFSNSYLKGLDGD